MDIDTLTDALIELRHLRQQNTELQVSLFGDNVRFKFTGKATMPTDVLSISASGHLVD